MVLEKISKNEIIDVLRDIEIQIKFYYDGHKNNFFPIWSVVNIVDAFLFNAIVTKSLLVPPTVKSETHKREIRSLNIISEMYTIYQ